MTCIKMPVLSGEKADAAFAGLLGQTKAGHPVKWIIPRGNHVLSQRFEVGENVTLKFEKGAVLVLEPEAELLLNCGIEAGADPIFAGSLQGVKGHISSAGYPQWFGLHTDLDEKAQTAAMQQALDLLETVLLPNYETPYRLADLRINRPLTWRGVGADRVKIHVHDMPDPAVTLRSSDVVLESLEFIYAEDEESDAVTFLVDTSAQSLHHIRLHNIHVKNPPCGIADARSGVHTVSDVSLTDVYFSEARHTGVRFHDFTERIQLKDVCVSCFGHPVASVGYVFENVKDMFLENVDVLGGFLKQGLTGGYGMVFRHCENVRCYRLMVDFVNDVQLLVQHCHNFHFSNFVVSLLKREGFLFEDFTDSVLEVLKSNGHNGYYEDPDPAVSVVMRRCSGLVLRDLIIQCNMGSALLLEDCRHNRFENLMISENRGEALTETADCADNCFEGLVCHRNRLGGVSLQGQNTRVHGAVLNDDSEYEMLESPFAMAGQKGEAEV
ncbi:MAG: hypothetical protein IKD06_02880 [Clostridia bacterium]|nr:hypothetical protein [Clostridia bacterium]